MISLYEQNLKCADSHVSITLLWKSRRPILTNSAFWLTIVGGLRMNPVHAILHAFSIRALQNRNSIDLLIDSLVFIVVTFWNYYIEMLFKILIYKVKGL